MPFSIFKVEVDIRKTGFKCYQKKDGGFTLYNFVDDKKVPVKISGLKDGVIAAVVSFNGGEVCPNQNCASKTARISELEPLKNRLTFFSFVWSLFFNSLFFGLTLGFSGLFREFSFNISSFVKKIRK